MRNTNIIVLGGLMACISALLQLTPVFFTEALVLITMLSALPIFMICRMSPKTGLLSYVVSFFIISVFSVHEALFFLFANGPVGVALGCGSYLTSNRSKTVVISAFVLMITLCIMNYMIGIPVFGFQIPGPYGIQILILFIFSLVYNFFYDKLCNVVYSRLKNT